MKSSAKDTTMQANEEPTESSTANNDSTCRSDDPAVLVSTSTRTRAATARTTASTATLLSSHYTPSQRTQRSSSSRYINQTKSDDYYLHQDYDTDDVAGGRYVMDNGDEHEILSYYSNDSSNESTTDGIAIYRRQSVGGESSKSLSSQAHPNDQKYSSIHSPLTTIAKQLKRLSGCVKNVYYKRLVLICITLCSALLGWHTSLLSNDDATDKMDAGAVEEQEIVLLQRLDATIHAFLIAFTIQVGIEAFHYQSKIRKLLTCHSYFHACGRSSNQHHHMHATTTSSRTQHPPPSQRRSQWTAQKHVASWVLFDVIVIVLSWILTPTLLILRCFNLLKGLRRAKCVSELRLLVQAMTHALPKVTALVAVLLVVLYVFAVLFCSYFGTQVTYFQSLDTTLWSLFQIMTLDGWSEIANETMQVYPYSWILFVAYLVVVVGFGMSLLVGIVCHSVAQAASERVLASLQDSILQPLLPPQTTTLLKSKPPPTPLPAGFEDSSTNWRRSRTRTLSSLPTVALSTGGISSPHRPPILTDVDGMDEDEDATLQHNHRNLASASDVAKLERKIDALAVQLQQMTFLLQATRVGSTNNQQ